MLILLSACLIGLFIIQVLQYKPNENIAHFNRSSILFLFRPYEFLRLLVATTCVLYLSYGVMLVLPHFMLLQPNHAHTYQLSKAIIGVLLLLNLAQLSTTATQVVRSSFHVLPTRKARTIAVLLPIFAKGIRIGVVLILMKKMIHYFYKPLPWLADADALHNTSIIIGIAWFLLHAIRGLEEVFNLQYSMLDEDLDLRKTYTHIVIIKRIAILLLIILTAAALLMTFKEVRNLGKGILISTGILTAVFGVSSKQPLEELLRGIQLAIAQPIRLNDTIVIEGEVGVVTAINLTHVIVTLWDKRQMIVPTNYFLDKSFENWTHGSKDLIGTIFFYVDYQLPIELIRQKFYEYLEANELGLWNKEIGILQVTDIKQHTVELRMLVSADDPDKLFDLRCDIREKILYTIQQTYPSALPKIRVESVTSPGPELA